jgi:CspA family cold shock protein
MIVRRDSPTHDRPVDGIVLAFDREEGVGAIKAPETPGGCWVHHSMIVGSGFRELRPGEHVLFTFERPRDGQDGYEYRAVRVWREG